MTEGIHQEITIYGQIMKNVLLLLLTISVIGLGPTIASAAEVQTMYFQTNNYLAGTIDPSFVPMALVANDGSRFLPSGSAIQPDGKILFVGSASADRGDGGLIDTHGDIIRLHADGTPDSSLHPDFIEASTSFVFGTLARQPLVQTDGRIILLMQKGEEEPTPIRLRPDGSLDAVFQLTKQGTWHVILEPDNALIV